MLRFALVLATCAGTVLASEPAPLLPAIAIHHVQTPDPGAYADAVAEINAAMKARHGVPLFLRVYAGTATGDAAPACFALCPAPTFALLQKNSDAFAADPALAGLRSRLHAAGSPGPQTLLKAVRFEGTHAPGWLFNTEAFVSDEAGYLAAIAELRVLLDEFELADARINVFRVIAGRSDTSHLTSINTPSAERLALVLDLLTSNPRTTQWAATAARLQSVTRNATYRELTRPSL